MTPAPFQRADALRALQETAFDLVVIGGGVTGAGVALDAASRGLRTAVIERDDFASGTSSKSSKLVHGGIRYLQQGEVGLVYEALAERQRLLDNAPHLVKMMPFLIPMFGRDGVIPAKIARLLGMAMWGYDLTGGFRIGRLHKRVTKAEVLEYFPTLQPDNLVSGYLYYDAAADDARLVLTILRTAAHDHGAVVANGVAAVGIDHDAAGRVSGVEVEADGTRFTIRARAVVNAAGVWADRVRELDEGADPDSIRPAKGIHITVPHHLIGATVAAVIPVPKDKRSVFVVPKGELAYIGTTDTDYDGPIDDPQCTPEDVAYLLRAINGACVNEITTDDIVGTWAGLRPLVKAVSSGRTADLSRRHKVMGSDSGMVTITGGKLTTYRRMAQDTVDAVVTHLRDLADGVASPSEARGSRAISSLARRGGPVSPRIRRSRTKRLRLRGAEGYQSVPIAAGAFPHVPPRSVGHLADRYGGEARALMGMIEEDPSLAEPLVEGLPYLRVEAVFAARFEMARSVDDVLSRRTRARLYGRDDALAAADAVADLIGPVLGWSAEESAASAADFRARCEAERVAAGLDEVHLAAVLDPTRSLSSSGPGR